MLKSFVKINVALPQLMNSPQSLEQLIYKAKAHDTCMVCCSNDTTDEYGKYELLAGYDFISEYKEPKELPSDAFLFGFCAYDLKNSFHILDSKNKSFTSFPDFYFFEPKEYYKVDRAGKVANGLKNESKIHKSKIPKKPLSFNWSSDTSKDQYLNKIAQIQEDIRNGAYYELNYCIHFEADTPSDLDVYELFLQINENTKSPFASFCKYKGSYLLCFSPERYLKKTGDSLISQPIKGTLKRHFPEDPSRLKAFESAPKERAENTMIVDLVRNDLSRVCKAGTVQVPELCGLRTFSHVHHLVSTVTGQLKENTSFNDIINASFPMGSMTGAPKLEVMKHIEEYESFKRGLYSGSVGYIENGDFDFNVVIRSLQVYQNRIHYCVGGAIVYDSIAQEEYEECYAKLNGIMNSN